LDLSTLDQNDRTAAIASAVLIIASLFAATVYVTWLAMLAALGMLFVILQPQIAPGVSLPGSKGSLMLILGGIAGVIMVLGLLTTLGFIASFGIADILYLVAIAAGLVMAWTGWQAFQAEGGKFRLGISGGAAPAPAPPESSHPAAAPESSPAAEPVEPAADRDPEG